MELGRQLPVATKRRTDTGNHRSGHSGLQNSLGLPRPRVECPTERRIERHSHIKRTDPTSEIRLASRAPRNKCCQYRRSSKGSGRRARILANRRKTRPRPYSSDTPNWPQPIERQVRGSAAGERPLPTPTCAWTRSRLKPPRSSQFPLATIYTKLHCAVEVTRSITSVSTQTTTLQMTQGHHLTFSFEDCVPKWLFPIVADYTLTIQLGHRRFRMATKASRATMTRTLKFALRYDPDNSLLEQTPQAGLAGGQTHRPARPTPSEGLSHSSPRLDAQPAVGCQPDANVSKRRDVNGTTPAPPPPADKTPAES